MLMELQAFSIGNSKLSGKRSHHLIWFSTGSTEAALSAVIKANRVLRVFKVHLLRNEPTAVETRETFPELGNPWSINTDEELSTVQFRYSAWCNNHWANLESRAPECHF
jgi:hypothetical protein